MRILTALALVLVLLAAGPALAAPTDDMDSQSQTEGYGKLFGYVCGAIAAIIILLGGYHMIKGFLAEAERGKKTGRLIEDTLDDIPQKKKRKDLYLGEKVPDWKIKNRREATEAALKFLAKSYSWLDAGRLTSVAEETFLLVKACVEGRTAKEIEDRVDDECLDGLVAEIKKLKKRGEIHKYDPIEVTDVLVVHFEAPTGKEKHTFTALISAKSRDCFLDDKTKKVKRGDKQLYSYQEFWKFKRGKGRWIVELIRTSTDMDVVLNAKNVMTHADLAEFSKKAEEGLLREFVGK